MIFYPAGVSNVFKIRVEICFSVFTKAPWQNILPGRFPQEKEMLMPRRADYFKFITGFFNEFTVK